MGISTIWEVVRCVCVLFGRDVGYRRTAHTLIDKKTMNHAGHRHNTAAMVPHFQLRCTETLDNRLCNKATLLKLEHIIINITY